MDAGFYVERLYPFQDEVLACFRTADTEFYLSGGTAASRGYLAHRFSDDLDLFVNDDDRFGLWSGRLIAALQSADRMTVEVLQRETRIVRLQVWRERDVPLKVDLINDVPAHVGPIAVNAVLGRLDSAENILANKITAALDRSEPKDLADIWGFCCQHGLSLRQALDNAGSKSAGVFPADLARVLLGATATDHALVRWIDPPAVDAYVRDLHSLGEGLVLPG